jgi:hypothetical protein
MQIMKGDRAASILVLVLSFVLLFMEMIEPKLFQFMRVYGHELFVVAVTMLGMGVGGLACFFWHANSETSIRMSLLLLPLSVLAAFFAIACGLNRYLVTLVCAAPYFFISLIISHTFIRFTSFRIYFASLFGSGLGVIAVYFLLPGMGGEASLLFCAMLAALTALIYPASLSGRQAGNKLSKKARLPSWIILILAVALFSMQIATNRFDLLRLAPEIKLPEAGPLTLGTHASRLAGAKVLGTRWNMISRIDVIQTPGHSMTTMLFPDGTGKVMQEELKREIQDSFKTELHMYSNNVYCSSLAAMPTLFTETPPYPFLSRPRVLVIGVGGGMDLAKAKFHNPSRLVGVEINPGIVKMLKGDLAEQSGRTYLESDIILLDGRTFIHFSQETFDLINLVFADLYIPFYNSNVYLESYLYTEEAFLDYMAHLKPTGYLAITKMIGTLRSPLELMRITSTLLKAAEQAGIPEPEKQIAIIGFGSGKGGYLAGTVLFKNQPFSPFELSKLRSFIQPPFMELYIPGAPILSNPFSELMLTPDRNEFLRRFPVDVSPTTDDKPFFYQFDRSLSLHKTTLLFFAILTTILFFIPYLLILASKARRGNPAYWMGTVYFAVLAAGYMFLESALVQNFNLYLGGGLYSLTLVVSCLLIFAGLGSRLGEMLSARLGPWIVWIAPILLILYFPLLERVADLLPGSGIPLRLVFAGLLLGPLCLSLGLPFPWALQVIKQLTEDRSAALMYGLNATVGVLAIVGSLWLSARFGLTFLYAAALALYLIVGILALGLRMVSGPGLDDELAQSSQSDYNEA